MMEVLGKIFLIIFLSITVVRLYLHRQKFAQLSKVEWLRFISGFLLSFTVGCTIIIGGIELAELYLSGILLFILKIGLVFLGLFFISVIFTKFIPTPLKEFYE